MSNNLIKEIIDKKDLIIQYINQISANQGWFTWYDTQVMQYNRDLRTKGTSDINIAELDLQAINKANEINMARRKIAEIESSISTLEQQLLV